jgi:hypothetical protein
MKKFFLVLIGAMVLNFTGCGKSSDEAKELLLKLLQLIGIPQSIVVNICQDTNKDGICNLNEPTATLAIDKGDAAEKILEKFVSSENGRYILEHYDPELEILMEIADDGRFNTGKQVTLPFKPKPIVKDTPQELSILQSLIDNGFFEVEEYDEIVESPKARNVIDQILLENIFQNQAILEEHNLTAVGATDKNLEFIAEGLRELNVTELVENLNECERNTTQDCKDVVIEADDSTEINQQDAKIIQETNSTEGTTHTGTTEDNNKTIVVADDGTITVAPENSENNSSSEDNTTTPTPTPAPTPEPEPEPIEKTEKIAADGYIIELSSPAVAVCSSGTYNSLTGSIIKGKLTFNGVALDNSCIVTIPKGSKIDSNNNGVADADDKIMAFDMKSIGDTAYISPLTTLMVAKKENGEDITALKAMVKDFDPVASFSSVDSMSGTTQTEVQKLLTLMEILKTTLSDSEGSLDNIKDINISTVINTQVGEDFANFNIENLLIGLPSGIAEKARAKGKIRKRLARLTHLMDKSVIDVSTFSVNISDGGLNILEALKNSVKDSAPQSVKDAIASAIDMDALIPKILKNGYSPTQVTQMVSYFNELTSNLSSLFEGNFNINFGDINSSSFTRSRYFKFDNLSDLEKVYKVYNLDDLTPNYNNSRNTQVNSYNYSYNYQKSYDSESNIYSIAVNHPAQFEIVDGLDSQYFQISQGNRQLAYVDLKNEIDSPTEERIYKVEIKATDVQTLESKSIVLKFKIDVKPDSNPVETRTGYISKYAQVGGVVLNTSSSYYSSSSTSNYTDIIQTSLEINSMNLIGEGADDFEIFENKGLKVVNTLDYNTKPEYNLILVVEDNKGNEFNQSLNIQVTNDDNRTVEFEYREDMEKILIRTDLLKNNNYRYRFYSTSGHSATSFGSAMLLVGLKNYNPAKFEIVDGLDSKFFRLNNENRIDYYNWLDDNSSLSPTYKNKEDANADGIYEVTVKAKDVQTLEENTITFKFQLVSSNIRLDRYNSDNNHNYFVSEETVIGGEVPSFTFFIDIAEDVMMSEMNITGVGADDFNLSNNALTVVNQLSSGTEYNLTINWKDTTGYSGSHNILVHVNSGATHNDLNITNMNDITLNRYVVNWYDFWYTSIDTNNLTKATHLGDKESFISNRYSDSTRHSRYHYFYKEDYNYDERPTYLNPKDSNQDNLYETTVTLTDIQNLQTKSLDFTLEMLSHKVKPYLYDYNALLSIKEANVTELSIIKYASVGGELLTSDGAKGFYTQYGQDISFSNASLEGDGADNFAIGKDSFGHYNNTITLAKSLIASTVSDYYLEVLISDSESQSSRHPLHIHIEN